jgi:hypothetical protein
MDDHMKWDSPTDTWRVSGHLNWYIRKVGGWFNLAIFQLINAQDDVVGEMESVSIDFFRTVPIPAVASDFVFYTPLFSCELPYPPAFKWMNPTGIYSGLAHVLTFPKYIPAIKRACTLRSDLSRIPLSKFKKTTNSHGESFYEVKYALRVTLLDEVIVSRLLL